MFNNISKIGFVLSKKEQKKIKGGVISFGSYEECLRSCPGHCTFYARCFTMIK